MDTNQAYEDYVAVRRNYLVSLMAAKLMLGNDYAKDQISAHLQAAGGFDPTTDKEKLQEQADAIVNWVHEESNTDFQGIRRAYLIGTCGALEHLAKCCFVMWVNEDSEVLERIKSRKLAWSLSEFLSGDRQAKIFIAADRIFQETEARRHYQKFCAYVRQLVPAANETALAALEEVDADGFDEAYMVRNRLVHHGASADQWLAKAFGIAHGETLQVSRDRVVRYMRALDAMASAIDSVMPSYLI